jgi:hypothetical protein
MFSQRIRLISCLAALALLGLPVVARADAIVVTKAMTASTIAEIFIAEGSIRVELEIGGSDLRGFRNLMPDGLYEHLGYEPRPLRERLGEFLGKDLVFRVEGGRPFPGRVLALEPRKRVPRDEITGEPLPTAEGEGEDVVYAELEYRFEGRPATIAMRPPLGDEGQVLSTVGMMTYHEDLPVNDFRYLSTEEILDLDWDDPWYSKFRNRNLWRQYDAPINAFLYVEPYEVRAEIIVRPLDMESWLDLGLEGRQNIPVDMQYDLQMQIADFLAQHLNLTIDGEPVEPELDRVNFLRRSLRTSAVIAPPEDLDTVSATLGVIYVAPTDGLPQEASLTWDLFTDRIQRIPAAAADEAGPLRFFLQPDDNVLLWKNFLKNPTLPTLVDVKPPPGLAARMAGWSGAILAVVLVIVAVVQTRAAIRQGSYPRRSLLILLVLALLTGGCLAVAYPTRMTEARSQEIVAGLLHNIYRAFDFRGEENIYDVLEQSVSGELLTEIYLETRRGLELASQGGARAKVKEIEVLEVEPRKLQGEPGFVAHALWNVAGSVGHWGHIHTRTNQYEAELTIQPVDGAWRVTALEILQEERL